MLGCWQIWLEGFYNLWFYHTLAEYLGGFDKLLEVEGGAVALTLKDQSILVDGDINEGMINLL